MGVLNFGVVAATALLAAVDNAAILLVALPPATALLTPLVANPAAFCMFIISEEEVIPLVEIVGLAPILGM